MLIMFDFNPIVKIYCLKFFFPNIKIIDKNKNEIHKNKHEIHKNRTLGKKPRQISGFSEVKQQPYFSLFFSHANSKATKQKNIKFTFNKHNKIVNRIIYYFKLGNNL